MIKIMFVLTCNKCLKEKLFYGLTNRDFLIFLASRYTEDKMITRINEKSSLTCFQSKICIVQTLLKMLLAEKKKGKKERKCYWLSGPLHLEQCKT